MSATADTAVVVSTVFVGLGSNLEQPQQQLKRALDELAAIPGTVLLKTSSFYETAPVGIVDQPMFINAVAMMQTQLSPQQFLRHLAAIEAGHARVRVEKNGPRTLDLDVLLFGELQLDDPNLVVPHPRMHQRAFVLVPLLEIAPGVNIPGKGAAREWLARIGTGGVRCIAETSRQVKTQNGDQR